MPDETLIAEIENILSEVIRLGGENERSQMVPNLTVQNASPGGLDGYIIVSDDRDGDNIIAQKVGGVIYADNDFVNVIFPRGGEAIAFQQGSQSANSGMWEIVPSTSTDIFYDKGNVGVGATTPAATIEAVDSSGEQLRLTHTEPSKSTKFTVDTNHDLTITPSSTGQIILQPTTDSTDFFQVLDADGGTPVLNVDVTNEAISVKTTTNQYTFQGTSTQAQLYIQDADTGNVRTVVFARQSDTALRGGQSSYLRARSGFTAVQDGDRVGAFNWEAHDGTDYNLAAQMDVIIDGAVAANTVPMAFLIKTSTTNNAGLTERLRVAPAGNIGINEDNPQFKLHVTDGAGTMPAAPSGDGIIIQNNDDTTDNARLTIIGGNIANSIIDFGDSGSANVGQILYNHSANEMRFTVNSAGNKLVINSSGDTGINVAGGSIAAQLHVDQSDGSAVQPVLLLDQADLSEEFINFVTTIGAGNPLDTAAIGTYYGKARVAVNGTFKYVALYNS